MRGKKKKEELHVQELTRTFLDENELETSKWDTNSRENMDLKREPMHFFLRKYSECEQMGNTQRYVHHIYIAWQRNVINVWTEDQGDIRLRWAFLLEYYQLGAVPVFWGFYLAPSEPTEYNGGRFTFFFFFLLLYPWERWSHSPKNKLLSWGPF